jgi:hypothetical protein
MEFEQQIIIKLLLLKGSGADEILAKLQAHFEDKASAMRDAKSQMGGVQRRTENVCDKVGPGRPAIDDIEIPMLPDPSKLNNKYRSDEKSLPLLWP